MDNCYNGINIPTPIAAPCGGEYVSTDCVATPATIPALDISAGNTQTQVNAAITNALLYKEEQITTIVEDITPFLERKIFRGTFLDSAIIDTVEDTIGGVVVDNPSTGVYTITSSAFTKSTIIIVTPNATAYDNITVTYDYSSILGGIITLKIKDNGTLVNLLESPIKIEI